MMAKNENIVRITKDIIDEGFVAYDILRVAGIVPMLNEVAAKTVLNNITNIIGSFMEMYIELQSKKIEENKKFITALSTSSSNGSWLNSAKPDDIYYEKEVEDIKPISKKKR
jgi:hypothetical protein